MGRLIAAAMAVGLLFRAYPGRRSRSPATFGTPTADSTFATGIVFQQPITIDGPSAVPEILLTVADAIGPTVFEVSAPSGSSGTLTYTPSHRATTT
jgi:hypothetical protein